jgi:hypothetical protein
MNGSKVLRILIAVVFIVVLVAVLLRMSGPNSVDQTGIGDSMVNLAELAPKINAVEMENGSESIRAERGSNGWMVTSRDGFPAKPETIQEVVRGLISLKKSQRMTAKPDRHGELGLAWPDEKKESRRLRVFAEGSAEPVVDLIVGRAVQAPTGVYVRKNGENQSWRCIGTLGAGGDIGSASSMSSWLFGPIADISADELQEVDFDGLKMTKKDGQWSIDPPEQKPPAQDPPTQDPPTQDTKASSPIANPRRDAMKGTLPYLLSGFQPEDVRREKPEDLSHPNQLSVILRIDADHTVDALLWKEGDAIWIRLALGDCAGQPNEKLTQTAAQWSGWVFKMPSWRTGYLNPLFEAENHAVSAPKSSLPEGSVASPPPAAPSSVK